MKLENKDFKEHCKKTRCGDCELLVTGINKICQAWDKDKNNPASDRWQGCNSPNCDECNLLLICLETVRTLEKSSEKQSEDF